MSSATVGVQVPVRAIDPWREFVFSGRPGYDALYEDLPLLSPLYATWCAQVT
jgi:hypothetical protein